MSKVRYTEEDLQEALKTYRESVQSGKRISYNELSRKFNIPSDTIRRRINKPSTKPMPPPKQSALTREMQIELKKWICKGIIDNQIYCSREFIRQNAESLYKFKFPNGEIKMDDIKLFFKTFPYLAQMLSTQNRIRLGQPDLDYFERMEWKYRLDDIEKLDMSEFIDQWHLNLMDWIVENEVPENRIYNLDETCFDLTRGLMKLQTKYVDEEETSNSKFQKWDLLSTIMIVSLSGKILPPVIIYKGEEFNLNWIKNNPKNWVYGVTNSGRITPELMMNLFRNHFLRLLDAGKDKPPIGIILNGHISHKTIEFQNFCEFNNIKLHYVPTPSREIKQPIKNLIENIIKPQWKCLDAPFTQIDPNIVSLKNEFNFKYKLALEKLTSKVIKNAWTESELSMKKLDAKYEEREINFIKNYGI